MFTRGETRSNPRNKTDGKENSEGQRGSTALSEVVDHPHLVNSEANNYQHVYEGRGKPCNGLAGEETAADWEGERC